MKDKQGNKVKINVGYLFSFTEPGPCNTCVIVKSLNDNGTVRVFDPIFDTPMDVQAVRMWRPLDETWEDHATFKEAIQNAGGILDLTTDDSASEA